MAYFNGRYLPKSEIAISPDDRGFLFSDGLYEVIRSYDGRLFRAPFHLARMDEGARALRLGLDKTTDFTKIAHTLIRENGLTDGDAIVYFQITRGAAPRTHYFPSSTTPPTIYGSAERYIQPSGELENGIPVILVSDLRWGRCDIKTVSLLANVMARQQARERGAGEALFVRDGFVLEGTHSNLFTVFDGTVVTPPKDYHVLDGITRHVILELCEKLPVPAREAPIPEFEIFRADEVMMVGTTVEVTPVIRLNGEPVGDGRPGPITRLIQKAFREIVTT
jgi:D-alanine transaminase